MSSVFDVFVHCRILCLVGACPSMLLKYGFHRLLCFSNVRFLATFLTAVVGRLNRALYFKCLVRNSHHFAKKGVSGLKGSSNTVGFESVLDLFRGSQLRRGCWTGAWLADFWFHFLWNDFFSNCFWSDFINAQSG